MAMVDRASRQRSGSGGPFGNPIPGAGAGTGWASLPAVSRSTSLIVDTLAGLPWHVLRGTERLPAPDWIADPQGLRLDGRVMDAGSSAPARWSHMDVWTQWITSALWLGDGYVYVPARDALGAPRPPLYVLHPHDVDIDGGRYYVAGDELEAESIIHLRGMGPISGGHGTGVFDRFAATLGYSNESAQLRGRHLPGRHPGRLSENRHTGRQPDGGR